MRIFLDTNVLATAFATRGICEEILREVIAFHKLVSSKTVLAELKRVLKEKFRVPEKVCKEVLDFLDSNIVMAIDTAKLEPPLDNADITFASEAALANVAVFITGDMEVAVLKKVERMRIFSPRDFWEFLRPETGEIPSVHKLKDA